jgi:ectoine hydroxylase-related dioxygenase (phytanoyl-CoA dioxygenase family)
MIFSSVRSSVAESNERDRFEESGFLVVPGVLSAGQCDALAAELTEAFQQQQGASFRAMGGLRDVLRSSPLASQVAHSPRLISLVSGLLGLEAFPVRGILFDKNPAANWSVPWHQDLAIAVAERIETPGFGPWSVKHGIFHVQPPQQILASMTTVRLHLDECTADNGALRIIPGSHRHGELDAEKISAWTNRQEPVICGMSKGGALLMRPLLLHASSRARTPVHRRVLHLEYASGELPNDLKWFERS